MARNYRQGMYRVRNLKKYKGDPTQVVYRSSWEKKLFKWLDDHPNCISWGSEELIIPYVSPLDNEVHRYFPDVVATFEVTTETDKKNQTYLIEIKPYAQTQPPQVTEKKKTKTLMEQAATWAVNEAKWVAAQKFCKQKGWSFKILTEFELGMAK